MENTMTANQVEASQAREYRRRLEEYVQEDPMRATLGAAGLGFVLSLLPIRWMFSAVVALALHLARPVLMILGIMKLAELLAKRRGQDAGGMG